MTSIAFVVPEMLPVPPVEGGAVEGWVHEVSCEFARRAFEVTVVSRPAGGMARDAGDGGVAHVGIPWSRVGRWLYDRKRGWSRHHPLRPLVKVANVIEYAMGVRRALRALAPDVVYVHNDPYLAALLGRRRGRSLVLHMHNDHLAARLARPLLARVVARCDRVLCVSDFIRDRARAAFPADAARFQTVLNALSPATARVPAEPAVGAVAPEPASGPRYLYVGRLVPEKGVHVLLDAFAQLRRRLPQARLTIVGSSFFAQAPRTPYEQALRRRAQPLGAAVDFTGFVAHDRLAELYAAVDAVVAPAVWDEPFGLVVLEAMASGACVVASRVGGIPELIDDGRTGVLVPAGDADALARAMERVAADPQLRHRIGAAARGEAARRFPMSRLVDQVGACFASLLAPTPSSRRAATG